MKNDHSFSRFNMLQIKDCLRQQQSMCLPRLSVRSPLLCPEDLSMGLAVTTCCKKPPPLLPNHHKGKP